MHWPGNSQLTICRQTHTHTRLMAFFPGLPTWAGTRKVKTNLDFTEARDSEWQWHQLGHMQVCTLLQTGNHTSTPSLCFLQAGCPSCRPTNSIKALKASKPYWYATNHWGELNLAISQWIGAARTFTVDTGQLTEKVMSIPPEVIQLEAYLLTNPS